MVDSYDDITGADTFEDSRELVTGRDDTLRSLTSGASEPASPVAYMLWADTGNGLLKQRDAGNTAWVSVAQLGPTFWGLLRRNGSLPMASDLIMGVSPTFQQINNGAAGTDGDDFATVAQLVGEAYFFGTASSFAAGAFDDTLLFQTDVLSEGITQNLTNGSFVAPSVGFYRIMVALQLIDMDATTLSFVASAGGRQVHNQGLGPIGGTSWQAVFLFAQEVTSPGQQILGVSIAPDTHVAKVQLSVRSSVFVWKL